MCGTAVRPRGVRWRSGAARRPRGIVKHSREESFLDIHYYRGVVITKGSTAARGASARVLACWELFTSPEYLNR